MAPWVQLHVWPNGNVYPCCTFDTKSPLGNLNTATLAQIWNSPRMRALRTRMMVGAPTAGCAKCYELDDAGGGSNRVGVLNARFAHHAPVVKETLEDGRLERFNAVYLDVRFSNLCNFRCRTCGPELSSGWRKDYDAMNNKRPKPAVVAVDGVLAQLEPLLDSVEEIYFAGGEPLFMEEHYQLLRMLIDRKRTNVRLWYNTNFSNLVFREHDVLALWREFDEVKIGASLDGMGPQGEYVRKGQDWKKVEANRERLMKECPKVRFHVNYTLSVLNCFHVTDFHDDWTRRGLIAADEFYINLVQNPEYYRTQILPPRLKETLKAKYERYIAGKLSGLGAKGAPLRSGLESTLQYTFESDRTDLLPTFKSYTERLDLLRDERFAEVFPELVELLR